MSVPLAAFYRIELEFTVEGIAHKTRAYCHRGADIAGVPTVTARDTVTDGVWTDRAQGYWDALKQVYASEVTAPQAQFQHFVSGAWNPVDVAALTGAGAGTGSTSPANQLTMTLRDTSFDKVRVVLLETIGGYLGKATTAVGLSGNLGNLSARYTSSHAAADDPFNWQQSRGARYLALSPFVSIVFDTNNKMRRARGEA